MDQHWEKSSQSEDDPGFSAAAMVHEWWGSIAYALSQWRVLVIAGLIGLLAGLLYAWLKPDTFTSRTTFVVEDAKTGSMGSLGSLAGSLGFDIGNLAGGNGMLAGDNILELVKSRRLIRETLLTPYQADSSGTLSLADRYAECYNLKKKWENSRKVARLVNFPFKKKDYSRLEDSLLHVIIARITDEDLSITKPEKKLGLFEMTMTTRDERVSQLFVMRLLKATTDFYIDAKTQRLKTNVDRLQHRADSIGRLLNARVFESVETEARTLDINPAYASPTAQSEISARNKTMFSTIYTETVRSLEASRTALIQETPTVQVVDQPELPLKRNRVGYGRGPATGLAIALLLTGIGLIASRKKTEGKLIAQQTALK